MREKKRESRKPRKNVKQWNKTFFGCSRLLLHFLFSFLDTNCGFSSFYARAFAVKVFVVSAFLAIELQLAGYEMNRASWRRGSTSLLLRGGSKRRRCLPVEHRGHHLDCTKFIYVSSLLVWAPMPIVYHWSNKHCPCWKHGTKQNVCMPTYSEQESSVLLSREK